MKRGVRIGLGLVTSGIVAVIVLVAILVSLDEIGRPLQYDISAGYRGWIAVRYEDPSGALAYRLHGDALHVVALATDPMWQRSGVGGHLVAEAELIARRLKLRRLVVSTTNNNLPALYFYQRRGYRMTDFVPNSVIMHTGQEVAGFAGIPVRDEVRLEKMIAGES